jgi:hypothetical protein
MVSPANLCIMCKGSRALCGRERCPLFARFRVEPKIEKNVSKDFFGPSMNVFVGRIGYPRVSIGPLTAIELKTRLDEPGSWFGMDYGDIIELQSLLLRSKLRQDIHSRSRFVEETQELALASKPTDVEMRFRKKPVYRMSFSDVYQPMGPSASLEKMRITENPKISWRVEKIVRDEIRANEAGVMLYQKGLDVYKISTILSSGVLGLEKNRKLVPTRWSITSVHDMIANRLIREIKEYHSINEYRVYSSQYLDNHFEILLMPGNWEFENFEAWTPGSMWSFKLKKTEILEEYEPFKGRAKYADLQGGGFYSSRLGCCELLKNIRKQARVVLFREIYEGYSIPVGCWQILENIRNASRQPFKRFSTKEEALNYIDSNLRIPIKEYLKQSRVLSQRRLVDFST